jgi:N-methylhydantoinase A
VPPYAGNFSAWGLLGADLTQATARTKIMELSQESLDEASRVLDELFAELESRQPSGIGRESQQMREVGLDMRYAGQEHWLSVAVAVEDGEIAASAEQVREAFDSEYEQTFGATMEEAAEVVSIRATLRTPLPRREEESLTLSRNGRASRGSVEAYSFTKDERMKFDVVDRASLGAGEVLPGPVIIHEDTATTYLDAGFEARVDGSGCLFITHKEAAS